MKDIPILLVSIFTATLIAGCNPESKREATSDKPISGSSTPNAGVTHNESNSTAVYTTKDILEGYTVSEEQIALRSFGQSEILPKPTPISSMKEAIGKVAVNDLSAGTFICPKDIKLPSMPSSSERWLFSFSTADLARHLGKKISLKAHWITTESGHPRVIDYQGHTIVYIENPAPLKSALPKSELAKYSHFFDGQCVIATGVVGFRRASPKSGEVEPQKQCKYFIDERTVKIDPSAW